MLTANDMETDIVAGFATGADDYITKPFSLMVLRTRVEAVLRRAAPAEGQECFRQDGLCFDFDRMRFFADGKPVELSKTGQKLLKLLVYNRRNNPVAGYVD